MRETNDRRAVKADQPSRRRFLKEVAGAAGGACLLSLGAALYTKQASALPATALRPPGALAEPDFELSMAALLHTVPNPASEPRHELPVSGTVRAVGRRLRLSNQESEQITWLVAHQSALDHAPSLPLCRLKRLLAHPWCGNLIKLVQAGVQAAKSDPAAIRFVEQYLRETPLEVINPPPLMTGASLIELGLTPGPQFQELLEQVRDAQLNGEITTADEAREMVRRLSKPEE